MQNFSINNTKVLDHNNTTVQHCCSNSFFLFCDWIWSMLPFRVVLLSCPVQWFTLLFHDMSTDVALVGSNENNRCTHRITESTQDVDCIRTKCLSGLYLIVNGNILWLLCITLWKLNINTTEQIGSGCLASHCSLLAGGGKRFESRRNTDYFDWRLSWFYQPFQTNVGMTPWNTPRPLPHPFRFINYPTIQH